MKGLPSYADISLLIMHVIKSDEINDKINELISSELDTETAETKAREIEMVNSTNEPENLVDLCRKVTDFHAKRTLWKKILENQNEAMPFLLKRFYTSSQDKYLETAALVLAYAEEKYIDELLKNYKEIRCEYAKAVFCIVLGFRQKKSCIPFLKSEMKRMEKLHGDTDYSEAPKAALKAMN